MNGQKKGVKKKPYRIFLKNEPLFFVPALYHVDKEKDIFASLLTTTPNTFIKKIHHRMPVILTFNNALNYFTNTTEENIKMCIPFPDPEKMEMERAYL